MPGNKRRSRNGSSSTASSSSSAAAAAAHASLKSANSLTKFFTNFNGFANGSSYNGYHHPHHPTIAANHQINSNTGNNIHGAAAVNGDSGTGSGIGGSSNTTNIGGTIFTAKQQQQLDRNAFLLTLTKEQLKVECRKRGQKTNGTKTELVLCGFCFQSFT